MFSPVFKRFFGLLSPVAGKLVLGVALILLATLCALPGPWIMKLVIDDALPHKNLQLLSLLLLLFAGMFLLRAWLTFVRNRVLQFAAMRVVCDLRIRLFTHIQSLSLRYFDANHTGKVISRITQDTGEVYGLTNGFLIGVLADSITLFGVLGFLFLVDWRLALAVSFVLPLFALNYLYNRKKMREVSRTHRDNWYGVVGFLHERISAARLVKSFAREEAESARFASGINADYFNFSKIVMRNTRLSVMADLLGSVGALVVLGLGGWFVIRGEMQIGTLVAFNAYIAFIFPPIVRFVDLVTVLQRAETSLENLFTILDTIPDVSDSPQASIFSFPVRGAVEFNNVSFDYDKGPPGNGRPRTLSDVSFTVDAGQTVAIVGPSGSGKCTLINLVCRFYDVASGAIRIDGTDVRDVTVASLREQIGIVLQENILFSGSLSENIAYGRPAASQDQIIEAARAANAHEFILNLPEGYDTIVGERGAKLSGGQRQRVAIARALLRDPRILIFDEATSALDTQSERLIQEPMDRLLDGRTAFVIAHRLSTIKNADLILVMDQGKLVEKGSHDQLLTQGGLYAHLHALQFRDGV